MPDSGTKCQKSSPFPIKQRIKGGVTAAGPSRFNGVPY